MSKIRLFLLIPLISLMFLSGCATNIATAIRSLDNDPDVITINREALVDRVMEGLAVTRVLMPGLRRPTPS